ncbi:MAG: Phosphoglycolate phosphatase [Eubacteriales bacterium SKADARSKE-1]|nr:Phosphoglycolate phosphatase [Eubacteriales bacterium SKADARSKE-1]
MLNYGECNIDQIPDCDGSKVHTIRVAFHKKDSDKAIDFCAALQKKGYDIFIQPMSTVSYTYDELINLIKKVNLFNPKVFYIVDSCGVMKKEDLLNMFKIVDENLSPEIAIGFHSHNNLQLSFANAVELINLATDRQLIIDSSVLGMGRGAGNLCTELLMQYLNENANEKYNIHPLYTIMDKHLKDIYAKTPWGYFVPFFISAKYKCHPNYAVFLREQGVKETEFIDELISKIPESKKTIFDKKYIKNLYDEFRNKGSYDCIAFDLDGTLIDSSVGILNAIRYAEDQLNIPNVPEETLNQHMGAPLKYTYGVLHGLNTEDAEMAIKYHKKYMSDKGYQEAKLYDGVKELLINLKNKNLKLAVATLKQESIAKKVLECLGIDKYFDLVLGQDKTEALTKSDLLNKVKSNSDSKRIVLIGDLKFDGEGAMKSNIDFIAVIYGMGFKTAKNASPFKPIAITDQISNIKNILFVKEY